MGLGWLRRCSPPYIAVIEFGELNAEEHRRKEESRVKIVREKALSRRATKSYDASGAAGPASNRRSSSTFFGVLGLTGKLLDKRNDSLAKITALDLRE